MQKIPSGFPEIVPDRFPPLNAADDEGLLAWSRDLDCEMLLNAYCRGIFPWPVEEQKILWFAPPRRAILKLSELHVSARLRQQLRCCPFRFQLNRRFDEVIAGCAAAVRKNQEGTWITAKMLRAYREFHRRGFACSFEAVTADGTLAGGGYGVWIGGFFAGESMFHVQAEASKFALVNLLEWLRDVAGLQWIDIQMLTPLLVRLGAREVSRDDYQTMLSAALEWPVSPAALTQLKTGMES